LPTFEEIPKQSSFETENNNRNIKIQQSKGMLGQKYLTPKPEARIATRNISLICSIHKECEILLSA
jgi:hypothetical protein